MNPKIPEFRSDDEVIFFPSGKVYNGRFKVPSCSYDDFEEHEEMLRTNCQDAYKAMVNKYPELADEHDNDSLREQYFEANVPEVLSYVAAVNKIYLWRIEWYSC